MRTVLFCLLIVVHCIAHGAEDAGKNRDILAACMNYANEGQLDKYAECWSEDAMNNGRAMKKDLIMGFMTDIRRTFPDYRSEVLEEIVQGDTIVTMSRVSGTHLGVAQTNANGGLLLGAKATGKRFEVMQTHWWKLKAGKIVFHRGVRDDLSMMRQLGLVAEDLPAPLKVDSATKQ
jgi:predicted ester cyclase